MTRSHKIGWLVLVIAVLFMLWRLPRLNGQGFGSFSHDQPYFAKDAVLSSQSITNSGARRFYWNFLDLTNGAVTEWTDRVSQLVWKTRNPASPGATKDANGIYTPGGNDNSLLTNAVYSDDDYASFCWIMKPIVISRQYHTYMVDANNIPYEFNDESGSYAGNAFLSSANGANIFSSVFAYANLLDVVAGVSNGWYYWYTNGVLSSKFSVGAGTKLWKSSVLLGKVGYNINNYKGYYYELMRLTNSPDVGATAQAWHSYRTNVYGL